MISLKASLISLTEKVYPAQTFAFRTETFVHDDLTYIFLYRLSFSNIHSRQKVPNLTIL